MKESPGKVVVISRYNLKQSDLERPFWVTNYATRQKPRCSRTEIIKNVMPTSPIARHDVHDNRNVCMFICTVIDSSDKLVNFTTASVSRRSRPLVQFLPLRAALFPPIPSWADGRGHWHQQDWLLLSFVDRQSSWLSGYLSLQSGHDTQ
jgi:hypothetical protein